MRDTQRKEKLNCEGGDTVENLLNVADIAARYKCSLPTARARMRQMEHMEKPLMVTESAVRAWEAGKMLSPGKRAKAQKKRKYEKTERVVWIPGVSRIPLRS
jgi:hypothetical protein